MSLKTNHVTALFHDSEKRLWVATIEGVLWYDPENDGFINPSLGLPDNIIKDNHSADIMEDSKGRIWLAPSGIGVVCYSLKDKTSKLLTPQQSASPTMCSRYIQSILEDKEGKIWMGSRENGISVYDPETDTYTNYNTANSDICGNSISDLVLLDNGNIIITSIRGGASMYDAEKKKIISFPDVFNTAATRSVFCALQDHAGNILLGTENKGILVFDPLERTLEQHPVFKENAERLGDTKVQYIYEGAHNYLWFALYYKGVLCVGHEESGFKSLRKVNGNPNSLNCGAVMGVCTDKEGRVWMATDGGGLNCYDPAEGRFTHYTHDPANTTSLSDNATTSVFCDSKGRIWVSTLTGGLCLLDCASGSFTRFSTRNGLKSDRINSVLEDKDGYLWIATFGGGLSRLNPETLEFKTYFSYNCPGLVNDYIYKLFIDSKNRLWIGSYYGLSYMDIATQSFHGFNRDQGLSSIVILSVAEDPDGIIWVGTGNGLNRYDEEQSRFSLVYPERDELSSTINGLLTHEDQIWMSTNHGIIRYTPEQKEVKRYYYNSGLPSNEFISGSYHKDSRGRLFFGGIEGLNFFYPKDIYNYDAAANVFITSLKINNQVIGIREEYDGEVILTKNIAETKKIKLKHTIKNFTLDYVSMGIFDSYSVVYAYKLEGFDKNWLYTDYQVRSVTYTNLNPGTYSFMIKASSNPDVWGNQVTTLVIEIEPAPWDTWWAKLLYILAALGITYFTLRFAFTRIREKNELRIQRLQMKQQEELNVIKTNFFTNISHEFRTPLTLIIGPLRRMVGEDTDKGRKEKGSLILRNAERLQRLVNQILDINKIEDGKMPLHVQEIELVSFVSNSISLFTELTKQKQTSLTYHWKPDEIHVWYDVDMLDKCLNNLLYNAYKFTPEGGKIDVGVVQTSDTEVLLTVSDTGVGIKKEALEHVFDRFFQGDAGEYPGSGIGMHLARTLIELHKGSIRVESEEGKGTTFYVTILLGKDHFKPENFAAPQEADPTGRKEEEPADYARPEETGAGHPAGEKPAENKPLLLLIDDDADMRLYIRQELEDRYTVREAVNGMDGFTKARELMPEIIVTDVMMPEMNGKELCRKLKTDVETSHIPVILLTAQTEMEQQIEGLETGADSYISKPFSPEYLRASINSILENRQRLKDRFSKSINTDAKELTLTSVDERLLQNVIDYIRANIENTDLSVEGMSKDLGLSRTHLHRKLKGLTGQSPIEFIKTIRMKQAAYLLGTGKISIAEVAYKVGYNTPSYFSNSFNSYFGMSPSEYIEKNKK